MLNYVGFCSNHGVGGGGLGMFGSWVVILVWLGCAGDRSALQIFVGGPVMCV